jgi:hypothetical protein
MMQPCWPISPLGYTAVRLWLDRSRWRLCTPHWRPVDRGHCRYTEDTDWGPVQVDWNWYFHNVVCRAGKARERCMPHFRGTEWWSDKKDPPIPSYMAPCSSLEWHISPGSFMGVWCDERHVGVSCR